MINKEQSRQMIDSKKKDYLKKHNAILANLSTDPDKLIKELQSLFKYGRVFASEVAAIVAHTSFESQDEQRKFMANIFNEIKSITGLAGSIISYELGADKDNHEEE